MNVTKSQPRAGTPVKAGQNREAEREIRSELRSRRRQSRAGRRVVIGAVALGVLLFFLPL